MILHCLRALRTYKGVTNKTNKLRSAARQILIQDIQLTNLNIYKIEATPNASNGL